LSLGDNDEQLADTYNITMRLVEMGEHFKRFNLQDVFYIMKTKLDPNVHFNKIHPKNVCIWWMPM